MNSRELVLGRIRDAITLAPACEGEIPRNYRTGRTMPDGELIDLFVDRLVDYKAHVHHCAATEIAEAVAGILRQHGLNTLGIPAGLDRSWVAGFDGTLVVDSPDVPAPELENLDAVVTGSKVACAETGTIFLDAGPEQGRRALTLVPDTHLRRVSQQCGSGSAGGDCAADAAASHHHDQRPVGDLRHRTRTRRRCTRSAKSARRDRGWLIPAERELRGSGPHQRLTSRP